MAAAVNVDEVFDGSIELFRCLSEVCRSVLQAAPVDSPGCDKCR